MIEDNCHIVAVNQLPVRRFGQNVGEGGVFGSHDILNRILLKKILPSWFDMHHLQIRLKKLLTIKIVAVINRNFYSRIESINQVTAPGVRRKDWAWQIVALEIIYGVGWESIGVEARVHKLLRSERAAMKNNPAGKCECRDGPYVSAKSGFDILHSLKEVRGVEPSAVRRRSRL